MNITLRISVLVLAGLLAWQLTGCGESAEHRLQRAQIALTSGKPDTALDLAQSILAQTPGDPEALRVKADAHLRLLQLDPARQTLDQILAASSDDEKARRLMISWSLLRLENLLGQSDFAVNTVHQSQFEDALLTGRAQADWLKSHANSATEAEFTMARLDLADAFRYRTIAASRRRVLGPAVAQGTAPPAVMEEINRNEDLAVRRRDDVRRRLESVLQADPRHFEATDAYLTVLADVRDHEAVWALAQRLRQESDLPVGLANRVVLAVLTLPQNFKPASETIELGRAIQEKVDSTRRDNNAYRLSDARLAILAGQPEKAVPLLDQIIKIEPRNQTARYLKAQCLYLTKDLPRAKQMLGELASEVQSPEVQTLFGVVLMELNEMALAREALRKAIELNPEDVTAQRQYLVLQAKSGQIEQAAGDVDAFMQRNPADPRAIRFKLQYEVVRNNRQGIATMLERVAQLDPLTDEHLAILADGHLFLQNHEKARDYADQLAKRRPDQLENQIRLAQSMLMLNQDEQVKLMLRDLRQRFPDSASPDQLLAEMYVQRGSYDRAVELLNAVIEEDAGNKKARILLVRALGSMAQFDEALDHLDLLLQKDPRDATAHSLAARIYQVMGRHDKAGEHLAQIELNQVHERTDPVLLAQLRLRQGQMDEAADVCNRALAVGNPDPALRQILASIYVQKGDLASAEANLLALVRAQPNSPGAYQNLAEFYAAQKMVDKGLAELQLLQTINEPYARVAQAAVLNSAGRTEEAIGRLTPLLDPLIRQRDRRALTVADNLARLHVAQKNFAAAHAVYEGLILADYLTPEAQLRQIDLASQQEEPERVVARLDALVRKLGPQDRRVKLDVIRRYSVLRRYERALSVLEDWIKAQPALKPLYRLKAELQIKSGKVDQSIATVRGAVERWPDDELLLRQLALTYIVAGDFPNAQAAYEQMIPLDYGARINALADLGQMFVGLGLHTQARAAFERIEEEGKLHDPRVMLAMGKALYALGVHDQARTRLDEVPVYTPQYAAAQILLTRVDLAQDRAQDARERLQRLAADSRLASGAAAELLRLNLRERQVEDMVRWLDANVATEDMPAELRRAWLNVRVGVADLAREMGQLGQALGQLAQIYPNAHQLAAARAVVMVRGGRSEQARQLYLTHPDLPDSRFGPLLAVVVGEEPRMPADYPAFETLIVHLARGDLVNAHAAAAKLPVMKTIYGSDVRAMLERTDIASSNTRAAFQKLAAAVVAQNCNLAQTAADVCQEVLEQNPTLTVAYAMWAQAMFDLDRPIDPVGAMLQRAVPDSGLALFLQASQAIKAKDHARALAALEGLHQREPTNDHIRYNLSQVLAITGQHDRALAILEEMYARGTAYQSLVANDLAYLLAEHKPQRLDEAYGIATQVQQANAAGAAFQDTLGWIEHLRGDSQAAVHRLAKAVTVLNEVPDVHYHLGVVYRSLGNAVWARYHFEAAARHGDNPAAIKARDALSKLAG